MEKTIKEIRETVDAFSIKIGMIQEAELSAKSSPTKWSKKEVLGHLIDSAHNNLRRFICGQYESSPPKITYEQDFWVRCNDYEHRVSGEVISYWKLINEQICSVLQAMPKSNYGNTCDTGKDAIHLRSLEWLAEDYVKHMKHHLNQIIPGSFDIFYK